MTARCLIIAEAGVNHNGDMALAEALVDAAADAGADAVKFQTFQATKVAATYAPKAAYQKRTTENSESQLEMLQRLELSQNEHKTLIDRCEAKGGLQFMSSPFDVESVRFLAYDLNLPTLKIPSGEITNGPLLLCAAQSGKDLIVSTGMSDLNDVRHALSVIAFGMMNRNGKPNGDDLDMILNDEESLKILRNRVSLLHCTSAYPTDVTDVNLRAMDTLADTFGTRIGYSDHTLGATVAVAAVARGATIIEKHMTLDCSMPGPDHFASLEPDAFKEMVDAIRVAEAALGSTVKAPSPSEIDTRNVARKSLIARVPITTGDKFTGANIDSIRPSDGISPMRYWDFIGRTATRDYAAGEQIDE